MVGPRVVGSFVASETLTDAAPQFTEPEGGEEKKPMEYFCGIGKCRPKFLQIFRNAKFFTFLLCCNCFIEGALASGKTIGPSDC